MTRNIFIIIIAFVLLMPFAKAQEPLKEVYIRYNQVSWQTYDFFVVTNLNGQGELKYEWNVNNEQTFQTPMLRYFFPKGDYAVGVKVADEFGNVKTDAINLTVGFWSLQNNWLWWTLYLLIVLIVVCCWIIKIIYLLNKRRVNKHARYFMEALSEHGWIERAIEAHVKKT